MSALGASPRPRRAVQDERDSGASMYVYRASNMFDHTVDTIQEKASDIKVVQDRSGTVPVRGSKTHATTSRATFFCYELMTKRTHTKNSRKKETALYAFARIGTGGDLLSKESIGRPISNTGRVRSVLLVGENCYVFFR